MEKRGIMQHYLIAIIIAVAVLALVFIFIFFIKKEGFSSILDQLKGLLRMR